MYPGYYDHHFLPQSALEWIEDGNLDQEMLLEEINKLCASGDQVSCATQLKMTLLQYLDEEVINEGLPEVLEAARNGDLSLDEYVMLICNSRMAREMQYPIHIPWDEVKDGIHKKIDKMVIDADRPGRNNTIISDFEHYSEDELSAYNIIDDFRKNEILIFEKNRRLFIELMATSPTEAFQFCKDKRFKLFDNEMASVTLASFQRIENYDKANFASWFEGCWKPYRLTNDMKGNDRVTTIQALDLLSAGLQELEESLMDKPIAR